MMLGDKFPGGFWLDPGMIFVLFIPLISGDPPLLCYADFQK